jgi:DHA1 family bicyclomycin/chloramphenicol resistance-like MFS transporter
MTAFILGLAVGQLVCGPASDALGRRRMLLASCASFAVLSAICGVAPHVAVLLGTRALQGFAGGCGVAVGRAVVSDRYTGADAAARFGTLASITLLAPIVAPAVGGVILTMGDWRTVFGFLTLLGIAMTLGVAWGIPETLAPEARSGRGLASVASRMHSLLRRPAFVSVVAVQCFATAGFFTYIGGSSIVLQEQLGLSPGEYTVLFATNAAAMAAMSLCFRLTVRRVGPPRLRNIGLTVSAATAVVLVVYATTAGSDVRVVPTWILLAVTVAGMGLSIPATTAMAQELGRDVGGTASALQGGLIFGVGALATPLTGLTGRTTVAGMAAIMATLFLCAVAVQVFAGVRTRREPATPGPRS